ncbi:MAG TPA: dihydroorotase, partial [Candidatus Nitrosotenuis sp.]|nr:dihydroorotase [Candidatus Nitrosotenuis sp.]
MTADCIILDSHIITPKGVLDRNIVIDDGKIVGFTTDVPQCDKKINARGLVAIPGLIDTHVHYGVYSPIEEAAKTESRAAALGGVTTMMRMLRLGH